MSKGHSSFLSKGPTGIRSVDALPVSHTFGEFLAALIDGVAANELRPKEFISTVIFNGPVPSADIRWTFPEIREKEIGDLREEEMEYKLTPKTKWPSKRTDMFRTTEFSEETILRVGAVVGLSE